MTSDERGPGTIRLWAATIVMIILVIAVWKFIDYRMKPPPPPAQNVISDR